jgi:serine/threonine protein kinase
MEELISSHEADDFMPTPALSLDLNIAERIARLEAETAGQQIGNYKLIERIGEGGFGTVWLAEQKQPLRRKVAFKIIKLGMDTRAVIGRFEQERQALAVMDHPNIAKVFDAGATQFGRPYFVMELVHGTRITDYCDDAKLPMGERLKLFVAVCQAVQHAHQKGIIHRDLKPSNILVTLQDGISIPKVIDFGVAKAMRGRLTDETIATELEQMVGSLDRAQIREMLQNDSDPVMPSFEQYVAIGTLRKSDPGLMKAHDDLRQSLLDIADGKASKPSAANAPKP